VQKRTPADTGYLVSLMDWLENNNSLAGVPRDERRAHLESFALTLFANADEEDRKGAADMDTAKCFYSAAVLFEVALQFGPPEPDVEQKAAYAMWKVADIRRAIKAGVAPTPGGPGDLDPNASAANAGAGGGAEAEEDALTAALSQLQTPGAHSNSFSSSLSSSSLGAAPKPAPKPAAAPAPAPAPAPYHAPAPAPAAAPAAAPAPPAYGYPPAAAAAPASHSPQQPQQPQQQQQYPSYQPQQHQPQYSPASAASSAASPSGARAPGVTGRPGPGAPLTVTPNPTGAASRGAACKEADRLSRHVSSSLNFDDVPTAIAKLKQALELLLPYEFDVPQY